MSNNTHDNNTNTKQNDVFVEKRKYHRIKLIYPIRLYDDDLTYEEYFGDLSLKGCKSFSYKSLDLNSKVVIGLTLAHKEILKISGTIVRKVKRDKPIFLEGHTLVFCPNCKWTGHWLKYGENGIKFVSNPKDSEKCFEYILKGSDIEFICPKCNSHLENKLSDFYELGIEFNNLEQSNIDSLTKIIRYHLDETIEFFDINRQNERLDVGYLPVEIESIFEDTIQLHNTYMKNLSAGGMLLYSNDELKHDQEVNITLGVKGHDDKFKLIGKIVRTSHTSKNEKYKFQYGIQFIYHDNSIKHKLHNYINDVAKEDYNKYLLKKSRLNYIINSFAIGINTFIVFLK